ncbi:MAG: GNAT family N-acetyltransferase [Pleurocapsa sp. MO_192.B19]|nr:GNAT family N-acetyltransferase [Pleurocapsa sp. MO_192.B19]
MNCQCRIRLAKFTELSLLNKLENEAAIIFKNTKYALEINQAPLSLELLQRQQKQDLVWVAANEQDRLVGFAVVLIIDKSPHLHELSVIPEYSRQGIGTKLVHQITTWAKGANFTRVTLSTFRDIPWNAPFYRKLGFSKIKPSEIKPGLENVRNQEADAGLPIHERILMTLQL